ncbi:MAG TPA: NAD(P)-binding domain-containing protein [Pyrinomonadaceae bacterium]|jgi:thioredoxin reductase (NADPH)|nr:NAD(P)-binding domain-containing protein [Pyrinomonadaceae bacterium]
MYDLLIIGAGPGGIALAAEAQASGIDPSRTLVLEKAATHNWAIRQLYPKQKLTTANYKGFQARCEGLLCIGDMTKTETLQYFDRIIESYKLNLQYETEVFAMGPIEDADGARFRVESSKGTYEAKVLAIGIGIFGRPNKPKEYRFPPALKERLLFDITSQRVEGEDVLVVGGGDTAAEYVEYLRKDSNRVTLSYRGTEFIRPTEQNRALLLGMEQRGEVLMLRGSNINAVETDDGRPRVIFKEEQYQPRTFDRVVYALGGTTPSNFLRMLGIKFDDEGPVFNESGETDVPGLFLIGDLVVGKTGGSIITAFNSAVRAMRSICAGYFHCNKN